tara:strand:+ start:184 stop:645 length:462 start_codon:yes stop_codon:yes gene_type:complete
LFLLPLLFGSVTDRHGSNFYGEWELDTRLTMTENGIRSIDLDFKTDIKITFGFNGTYTEEYLNHTITGSWFPHNENLVESRTDSDIKIKKLKKHIRQKIKSGNKNKNKMIRLLQRMHRLNRISTKSFKFRNNYIYAYDKQHSWILVFTKRDKN